MNSWFDPSAGTLRLQKKILQEEDKVYGHKGHKEL